MFSTENVARLASKLSAPLLDRALKKLSLSRRINVFLEELERRRLHRVKKLNSILVVPDINIGDAVLAQSFVSSLKEFFPDVEMSYVYQSKASPLIKSNPNIDRHFSLFRSFGFPSQRDCRNLTSLINTNDFDLIFNFCPYFSARILRSNEIPTIHPLRFISNIIRAYSSPGDKAQILFQFEKFFGELVEKFPKSIFPSSHNVINFSDNCIYTTQQPYLESRKILKRWRVNPSHRKIFFNPDTASLYTFIPFNIQRELLEEILTIQKLIVFLSSGYNFKGIEKRLVKEIPSPLKRKIIVIPKDIPLDVYAALIDSADMFISGDTGPLHIAAAKKIMVNSEIHFRNSTAVVGIFGATSARIYGYDSYSEKYLSTSQDAPSKAFEGNPDCKNLTCIDKIFKECPEVRCFDGIEPEEVLDYIQDYLC